jgi:hypothetical protein
MGATDSAFDTRDPNKTLAIYSIRMTHDTGFLLTCLLNEQHSTLAPKHHQKTIHYREARDHNIRPPLSGR